MRLRSQFKPDKTQLQFEGILSPGEGLTITAFQPQRSTVIVERKAELNFHSDLSLRQMKLLTYVLGMTANLKQGEKLPAAYRIHVGHYAGFTGLTASNLFSEIKEIATSLQKTIVYFFDEVDPIDGQPVKSFSCTWIRYIAQPLRDGYLTIVLDDKVRERLEHLRAKLLKGDYSLYELYHLLQRSSVYSIHFYRWAKQQAGDSPIVIELRELRIVLHAYRELANGSMVPTLETWDELRRRALDPAVKEINEDMDLTISYQPIKRAGSKAVESVAFQIATKHDSKVAHIPLPFAQSKEDEEVEDEVSGSQGGGVAEYVREFQLKASQAAMIEKMARAHGLGYLHAQAELARKKLPGKRSGAFHKACQQNWAKYLKTARDEAEPKGKSLRRSELSANQRKLLKVREKGFNWRRAALEFDPKTSLPADILLLKPELIDYVLEAFERETLLPRYKAG